MKIESARDDPQKTS
jgi:hypothetical protein